MRRAILGGMSILAAATLLAVSPAYGQIGSSRLTATVPFDFYVADTKFSAGDYFIVPPDLASGPVLVESKDGGIARILALAMSTETMTPKEQARLVFRRYGEHYFLGQVWRPGSERRGQVLPISSKEREKVRSRLIAELVSVPLSVSGQ